MPNFLKLERKMASMFLINESIDKIEFGQFQSGVDELIMIEKNSFDFFYKNDGLYNLKNYHDLYQNYSQENQFRAQYLEKLGSIKVAPKSLRELSTIFKGKPSGFFGINFPQLNINIKYCISNNEEFIDFKKFLLSTVNHTNFSDFKEELFPNIIFCDNSENQMIGYGNGKYFYQCLEQFILLEKYLKNWKEGNFSYKDLFIKTSITLSPESKSTMNNYGAEREFKLPSGERATFELHIKLGNIRIHVLEDNTLKKIMIGYIGNHLKL
jgi:hypothetical protein